MCLSFTPVLVAFFLLDLFRHSLERLCNRLLGEVSSGRLRYQRSSLFLNHWLISRTGEEVVAREVFSRFKTFAEHDVEVAIDRLLQQMSRAAAVYRHVTKAADNVEGRIDRIGLFAYRIKAMQSDVMKSVLLALLDPERPATPPAVINAALDVIESWLTCRMLVRATTKSYTQVVAELVNVVRQASVDQIDQAVRSYLMSQTAEARYWPDDEELTRELMEWPIYRKVSRARLRMVLEAIEDHSRGMGYLVDSSSHYILGVGVPALVASTIVL